MASLERRLKLIEANRKRGKDQLVREALERLTNEELEALEEELLAEARARGEQPPPTNELLEEMKRWEAEGGPVNSGPAQRDVELQSAIDEVHEAGENVRRIREEVQRWQQVNPRSEHPQSVQSMAEVEEFDRRNDEWSKPFTERRQRLEQAELQLHVAVNKVTSLLPQDIAYEYKGKRYKRKGSTYRIEDIG
jgi:hypothetical protein